MERAESPLSRGGLVPTGRISQRAQEAQRTPETNLARDAVPFRGRFSFGVVHDSLGHQGPAGVLPLLQRLVDLVNGRSRASSSGRSVGPFSPARLGRRGEVGAVGRCPGSPRAGEAAGRADRLSPISSHPPYLASHGRRTRQLIVHRPPRATRHGSGDARTDCGTCRATPPDRGAGMECACGCFGRRLNQNRAPIVARQVTSPFLLLLVGRACLRGGGAGRFLEGPSDCRSLRHRPRTGHRRHLGPRYYRTRG